MYSYNSNFYAVPTFSAPQFAAPARGEPASQATTPRQEEEKPSFDVLHGDCVEILAGLQAGSANLVLTDPPYIAGYRDRGGRTVANDDNDKWLLPAFKQIYRVLADDSFCISFYGWTQTDRFFAAWKAAGFRVVGHITFPKRYTSTVRMLRYQHESAYLLAKGKPNEPENVIGDVIDWGAYTGNKLHPTQKPLSILLPLIYSFSKPGDMVLDPFCGSGSTLAAALMSGRHSKGIELAKDIAEVATRRLTRMVDSSARWADVVE